MRNKRYLPPLSQQMAVCDANYIRLLKLLPSLEPGYQRDIVIAGSEGQAELMFSIAVSEGYKYTSTLLISQQYPETVLPYYLRPEMQVRVYHDANAAEVISYQNHRYFMAARLFPNYVMYQPDEKQQLNLFLAEWLTLCQAQGMSRASVYAEPCSPL